MDDTSDRSGSNRRSDGSGCKQYITIEGAMDDVSDGSLSHRREDVWCERLIREP